MPDLEEALLTISRRCRSLPDLDGRSVEEILGYNERGAFESRRLAALERIRPVLDRPPVSFRRTSPVQGNPFSAREMTQSLPEKTLDQVDDGPRANEGLIDWLLACPEKGFFTPIESDSTRVPEERD